MAPTSFPQAGAQARRRADGLIGDVYAADPKKDILTLRWLRARGSFATLVCTSEQFARDWELTGKTSYSMSAGERAGITVSIVIAGFLFFGFVLVKACGTTDTGSDPAQTSPGDSPAVLNDAKALDEKYDSYSAGECSYRADDYLKSIAKYEYKWDDTGVFGSKFDKYRETVAAPGVLTMVSDKAKLSNGFGAFQYIKLLCSYDTQSKRVLSYSIESKDE